MSKRMIVFTITPHSDGKQCGECRGVSTDDTNEYCAWAEQNWDERHKGPFLKNLGDARGPECLAAESRLRELVEAGERLHRMVSDIEGTSCDGACEWGAALAAIKGEGR